MIAFPTDMRKQVASKLAVVAVSPKFKAILGALVGEAWTTPRLSAICELEDGGFLGMEEGDIGYNQFLGSASDLYRNLKGIGEVAELTAEEAKWLRAQVKTAGENS